MIFIEGRNNSYLIPGVFVTLGVVIVSFVSAGKLIPLILVPIGLFAAQNGLELDVSKKRYRVFGTFYGFRFGRWYSYSNPLAIRINLSSENHHFEGFVGGGMPGAYLPKLSGKSLTYNVYLETDKGDCLLFESLSYKFAQKIAKGLQGRYQIELKDTIAEKLRNRTARRVTY